MTGLKLAFLGTPEFAIPTLAALLAAGHRIAVVYCQPARRRGRGQKVHPSPVQRFAEEQNLPVHTPPSLKTEEEICAFSDLHLDVAIVAAYGLLLPKAVLEAPRLGCINLHPSLLPRWRGAAPVQRALLAGDAKTGATIMQMGEGLDNGPILLQEETPILAEDTGASLEARLARQGAALMVQAVAALLAGDITPQPQSETGVTYAQKLRREEGALDWRLASNELERRVRAFHPKPGAWFKHKGETINVQKIVPVEQAGSTAPGTLLDDRLTIACGDGAIRILKLQRPGRAALTADAFLRGHAMAAGTVLALPEAGLPEADAGS